MNVINCASMSTNNLISIFSFKRIQEGDNIDIKVFVLIEMQLMFMYCSRNYINAAVGNRASREERTSPM